MRVACATLCVLIMAAAIACGPNEDGQAAIFSSFTPEYYRAYCEIAYAQVLEPGLDRDDPELRRLILTAQESAERWAEAVEGRLTLSDGGHFTYTYMSFPSRAKATSLIDLRPAEGRARKLAGTWHRSDEDLTLVVTHEDGIRLTESQLWRGAWTNGHVVLPSTWDFAVVVDTHLRRGH